MEEFILEKLRRNTERVTARVLNSLSGREGSPATEEEMGEYLRRQKDFTLDEEIAYFGRSGVGASLHSETFNGISHRHAFFEVLYVLRGEVEEEVGGERVHLYEGDAIILNPAAVHTVTRCSAPDDIAINLLVNREIFSQSFYSIILRDGRLDAFFNRSLTAHTSFMEFHTPSEGIRRILEHLLYELFRPDTSEAVLESTLLLFFAELLRGYRAEDGDLQSDLLRYMAEHLSTVTLDGCAEHFGYHPKYFSSLVKKQHGIPFSALVKKMKLRLAESLLRFTDDSIEAIAERVGYRDPCSLYALFREAHETTPAEWRRAHSAT